jgi:adenosylcobyric acid synthase
MVQGTASHVGKSIVAAGLCRVFSDMGYRVAPFKSQNMSLNSFVTREGGEIARAQELQARAARVEPSVLMNPVLVKPKDDMRCELIILGESVGDFTAMQYLKEERGRALGVIRESLERLEPEYDLLVIEGAGSPAEINLRKYDICNMKVARIAKSVVLLVADIDTGGALASVVGTLALLRPDERDMVKGIIINKFRGDADLLKPGLTILEKKCCKKVLGVLPFMDCSCLDEEDTLRDYGPAGAAVAIIKLPHTSNFTDFTPLGRAVPVRWVRTAAELEGARAVILPGSRNTFRDLEWLRDVGLAAAIKEMAARGAVVIGVCGGYQMLGERLCDPDGVESDAGECDGLGLLPVTTRYRSPKVTRQVRATVTREIPVLPGLEGAELAGYEIHTGRVEMSGQTGVGAPGGSTEATGAALEVGAGAASPLLFKWSDGESPDSAIAAEDNVFGTHLHGIFDNPQAVDALLERLGLAGTAESYRELAEQNIDSLADTIREGLNLEYVCEMLAID